MVEPKLKQIWVDRTTGDRVKIIKILPGHVKLFDTDGANQGRQWQIEKSQLNIKFKFYRNG